MNLLNDDDGIAEARIFVFNLTSGSVSAAYGTVIILAVAFAIAAIGALLYYGLQTMSSGGYGYASDSYDYKRLNMKNDSLIFIKKISSDTRMSITPGALPGQRVWSRAFCHRFRLQCKNIHTRGGGNRRNGSNEQRFVVMFIEERRALRNILTYVLICALY